MKKSLIISFCIFLSGCAMLKSAFLPTPYQAKDSQGYGYSTIKLNSTTYQASFAGNYNTSKQQVQEYLMYYMADLTLSNGYQYYAYSPVKIDTQSTYLTVMDNACIGSKPGNDNWAYCTCTQPQPGFWEQVLLDKKPVDQSKCQYTWYDSDNQQTYNMRSTKQYSYAYTATSTVSMSHIKSTKTNINAADVKTSLAASLKLNTAS